MAIVTILDAATEQVAVNLPLKVALPGTQTVDKTLQLKFTGTAKTPVTLTIEGPNAGVFVAVLKANHIQQGPGGLAPPPVASSGPGGSPGSGTLPAPTRFENPSYSFDIFFNAPTPAPQSFTGILVVTWLDGGVTQTQSVTLTGTTAQITASLVGLNGNTAPGSSPTMEVKINYTSLDPSPLILEITNPQPAPGVTIKTVSAILPPSFGFPEKILEHFRTQTVSVPVSIGPSPGLEVNTQIQVLTSFQEFEQLDPPPFVLKFQVFVE